MAQKKTSSKPKPGSPSSRSTEKLENFECALPLERFMKCPKGSIKGAKGLPQRWPNGPSRMIH